MVLHFNFLFYVRSFIGIVVILFVFSSVIGIAANNENRKGAVATIFSGFILIMMLTMIIVLVGITQ